MPSYRVGELKKTKISSYRIDIELYDKLAFIEKVSYIRKSKLINIAIEEWVQKKLDNLKEENIMYVPTKSI